MGRTLIGGLLVIACAIAAGSGSPRAGSEALAGPALQRSIAGKTVLMSMHLGSLPITYRANGTMTAASVAIGRATGVPEDEGRWWIAGGNLCQRWNKWFSGQRYCHAISREGETLHWTRDDGLTGTAKVIR